MWVEKKIELGVKCKNSQYLLQIYTFGSLYQPHYHTFGFLLRQTNVDILDPQNLDRGYSFSFLMSADDFPKKNLQPSINPVSYTHLTLPTILRV